MHVNVRRDSSRGQVMQLSGPIQIKQSRQQLLAEKMRRFSAILPFHVTAQTWLLGWIDRLLCPPYWNDVHTGQLLPMLWLDAPTSVHPSSPCSHRSWRKSEDEERQQYEHNGRSEEGKKYHNEDEYVLYQTQYQVERTSGRDGGNTSRGCFG
jgi:hypothetical protein